MASSDMTDVTEWTALTQAMIGMAPEINRDRLKQAVDDIATKCNERWPLEKGGAVAIGADDLDADLTGFTEEVTVSFIGKTALCLFDGMDGPMLTAEVLKEAIDTLADQIESE